MLLCVLVISLLVISACGPSEAGASDELTQPEFVPVANCLTAQDLKGVTEAQVRACAGEPCSQAVEHTDSRITLSNWLYCAEQQCAEACYWHVRVYFENGRVSYTRSRRPEK
jgi:hypothetical protein